MKNKSITIKITESIGSTDGCFTVNCDCCWAEFGSVGLSLAI